MKKGAAEEILQQQMTKVFNRPGDKEKFKKQF